MISALPLFAAASSPCFFLTFPQVQESHHGLSQVHSKRVAFAWRKGMSWICDPYCCMPWQCSGGVLELCSAKEGKAFENLFISRGTKSSIEHCQLWTKPSTGHCFLTPTSDFLSGSQGTNPMFPTTTAGHWASFQACLCILSGLSLHSFKVSASFQGFLWITQI